MPMTCVCILQDEVYSFGGLGLNGVRVCDVRVYLLEVLTVLGVVVVSVVLQIVNEVSVHVVVVRLIVGFERVALVHLHQTPANARVQLVLLLQNVSLSFVLHLLFAELQKYTRSTYYHSQVHSFSTQTQLASHLLLLQLLKQVTSHLLFLLLIIVYRTKTTLYPTLNNILITQSQ